MIDHNCRPDIAHGCLCATCARDPGSDDPNGYCCEWHPHLQLVSDPESACGARVASCPDYQPETTITATQDATPDCYDFGADPDTNEKLVQCAQSFLVGRVQQCMAAKQAHDLTARCKVGCWGKWCEAVGISRDTGESYVRIAEFFGNCELAEKPLIEALPISLLHAAAKPSAPPELVERVKKGEIATNKEYQAEREALIARVEQAEQRAAAAKKALQTERDAREADKQQVAQLQAENRELQKRPVAELLSPDPAEIDRLVDERLKTHAQQPPTPDEIMAIYGRMQRYTSSVRDQWDTLRPQLPVLPPDMQRSFCAGLRKELARMMHEIGEEVSM